ncbi:MAG: RidA family protein, partial [Desulfobulbaceae bacterium]
MAERITYDFLPKIAGPYVHAVKYNGVLYISGITALGTPAQDKDMGSQCNEILRQLNQIITAENRSKKDLIKLTIFVKEIEKLTTIREQLFTFYEGNLPACSLVEISNLILPELR